MEMEAPFDGLLVEKAKFLEHLGHGLKKRKKMHHRKRNENNTLQNSQVFLKISKQISKAWRKSLTRAKRASLTRP